MFIYAPIERLKRVEILDTPGFNAPDPDHIAEARRAFDEAHVAIWLLDAPQAMKESERRVLSEISALGVPVQILANKADRLKPDALETVLAHVRDSLAASRHRLADAADRVLGAALAEGRLGDEAALAASGWAEVEALFAEQIVDASDALRERALRRKAGRIAAELAQTASARAPPRTARRGGGRAPRPTGSARARRTSRRERRALAAAIDKALEPARRELASDLRPIAALPEERKRTRRQRPRLRAGAARGAAELAALRRDREGGAGRRGAGGARRARRERRRRRRCRAVAAGGGPRARVLMGMVAVHDAPDELAARPIEGVVEAAIDAFAMALSAEAEAPVPPPASAAVEPRAQALRAALRGARHARPAPRGARRPAAPGRTAAFEAARRRRARCEPRSAAQEEGEHPERQPDQQRQRHRRA